MNKASAADTPVMRQYREAKAAYPDALLFFRMGDFYELFFEDAETAARLLDLALTSRNKSADDPIPMAGVPVHAASSYVQRLLDHGHKVAICEQMGDPSMVKGIVPREVVRVATPAFAYDDSAIDAKRNLFLASVDGVCGEGFGVAALDFTTGEFFACEAGSEDLALAELVRLDPREILVGAAGLRKAASEALPKATLRACEPLALPEAVALLDGLLGAGEAVRACRSEVALVAAARCIAWAQRCEPGRTLPVLRLVEGQLGETLVLDEAAQRHLELVRTLDGETEHSLLAQIDATCTAAGARLLRRRLLAPLACVAEIRRRLDAVELFVVQPGLRRELRAHLSSVADVDRLAAKLAVERIGPRDLSSLAKTLVLLPAIDDALSACPGDVLREYVGVAKGSAIVDRCDDLRETLASSLAESPPVRAVEGGVFREGFDSELDGLRALMRDGQRLLVELEGRLREQAHIASLKLKFTRVFGWYIEVTKTHLAKVPEGWRRKQTVATGERFTSDELDDLADRLAHAQERFAAREASLWTAIVATVAAQTTRLHAVSARLASLDVVCSLAEVAHQRDYTRPDVDDSFRLELEHARHPVVERLAASGRFVPNDVVLDAAEQAEQAEPSRMWIITGPNMAGKSTFMRQVALAVILAQMGSFVPAKRARIGIVDRILTRVGANDNLSRGESTFMVEMRETANILREARRRSLVVLDEIGRGTSTYDGLAIAWAVAEHLHHVSRCRALFATHYHELTEITSSCDRAENYSVTAREHRGTIVFFHALQRGAASRSYGVACAQLAGLPEVVLARARVMLSELEMRAAQGDSKRERAQLDLFAPRPAEAKGADVEIVKVLRALDLERTTPLDALMVLGRLRALAGDEP